MFVEIDLEHKAAYAESAGDVDSNGGFHFSCNNFYKRSEFLSAQSA
jgi:hypothetical protein